MHAHTHTHARTHARTHAHARAHARTHTRTHAHTLQVEHNNRLVLGDVVVALGGWSLAGASDDAIAQFIDEHAAKGEAAAANTSKSNNNNNNNNNNSSSNNESAVAAAAAKDDSDDSDDDPFGDGNNTNLLTVIVIRSLAVHVLALRARMAVAQSNLVQLLAQVCFVFAVYRRAADIRTADLHRRLAP